MKTVLITTPDDLMASLFWAAFKEKRKILISKIIILPSRKEVDFPLWSKPFIMVKLLGFLGVYKLILYKLLVKKVKITEVCNECVVLNTLDQKKLYRELSRYDIDILISVGASVVFSSDILSLPTYCCLNIHNGNINKFRGHFSTFWEILNKEEECCLTLHEMTSKVDSGEIYEQICLPKKTASSFWEIMIWKKKVGGAILAQALNMLDDLGHIDSKSKMTTSSSEAKYYPFPTIKDVFNFRF